MDRVSNQHQNYPMYEGTTSAVCVCSECQKERMERTKKLEEARDNFFGPDDDWEEIWTG